MFDRNVFAFVVCVATSLFTVGKKTLLVQKCMDDLYIEINLCAQTILFHFLLFVSEKGVIRYC